MIEKFELYLRENLVKKVTPDREEARALIAKAFDRLAYVKGQFVDRGSAPFVFEDVYEAVREAAQSLMTLKGYKPYSHEALISFLKEFYKFYPHEIEAFDRYRRLRNKAIYAAAWISPATCKDAIRFAEVFLPRLKKAFDEELKKKTA